MIKRWIMKDLFEDQESKDFITNFENALEFTFGCDAHYVYDVVLDVKDIYAFYKWDMVDRAFQVHLACASNLPDNLRLYLHSNIIDENLFFKVVNKD
jgi:hypothetical protein